jgi:hypothetical protein
MMTCCELVGGSSTPSINHRDNEQRRQQQHQVRKSYLAVLLDELESLDGAENLVDGSTHREVIDGDMLNHSLGIDDEQPVRQNRECNATTFKKHEPIMYGCLSQ